MQNTKLAKYWLALATVALAISGIFAITQILARTTDIFQSVAAKNFHTVSLILHVNLSVLTWFFAIACLIFSINSAGRRLNFYLASAGMFLMTISPFMADGEAFLNNYVPFFANNLFVLGLVLIFASVITESVHNSFFSKSAEVKSLALLLLFSFITLIVYAPFNSEYPNSYAYYESFFWEFGHVAQFAYAQIMLICWVKLAEKLGAKKQDYTIFYYIPVSLVAITTLLIFFVAAPESLLSHKLFSIQMILLGGIAPLIFGVILFKNLRGKIKLSSFKKPEFSALFFSVTLFALGGFLGSFAAKFYLQGEESTIIPAHYHGSVIAITVAIMGYIYSLLPKIGLREVRPKLANIQIWFYASGQVIYIICLAILGGHGAPRKTPGTQMNVDQAIYHTMHFSGLLLMIGGFMFVYLIWRAFRQKQQPSR